MQIYDYRMGGVGRYRKNPWLLLSSRSRKEGNCR